jgi:hypothetical protein
MIRLSKRASGGVEHYVARARRPSLKGWHEVLRQSAESQGSHLTIICARLCLAIPFPAAQVDIEAAG